MKNTTYSVTTAYTRLEIIQTLNTWLKDNIGEEGVKFEDPKLTDELCQQFVENVAEGGNRSYDCCIIGLLREMKHPLIEGL